MQVRLGWQAGMRRRLGEGERYEPDYPAPPVVGCEPPKAHRCMPIPPQGLPAPTHHYWALSWVAEPGGSVKTHPAWKWTHTHILQNLVWVPLFSHTLPKHLCHQLPVLSSPHLCPEESWPQTGGPGLWVGEGRFSSFYQGPGFSTQPLCLS